MITLELGKYTYNNVKLNQYDKNFNIYMTLNNYTYKTFYCDAVEKWMENL